MGVVGSIRSGLSKIFKKGSKAVKNNIIDEYTGDYLSSLASDAISEGGWVFDESIIKSSNSNVLNKIKDTFSDIIDTVKTGAQSFKEGYTDYRKAKKGIDNPEGVSRIVTPEVLKAGAADMESAKVAQKAERKRLNRYKKEFKKTPIINEAKFNHGNTPYRKKLSYMNSEELANEGKKVGVDYTDKLRQSYIDAINDVSANEKFKYYESEKMSMGELYDRAKSLNIDTDKLLINTQNDFANEVYQKRMNNEINDFIESRRVVEEGAKEGVKEALEKQKKGLGFDGVWGNITDFTKNNPIVTAGALVAGGLVLTELLDED